MNSGLFGNFLYLAYTTWARTRYLRISRRNRIYQALGIKALPHPQHRNEAHDALGGRLLIGAVTILATE